MAAGEAERRLRARVKTLAREGEAIAMRLKVIECEVASLRTALTLVLDELDQLVPIPAQADR